MLFDDGELRPDAARLADIGVLRQPVFGADQVAASQSLAPGAGIGLKSASSGEKARRSCGERSSSGPIAARRCAEEGGVNGMARASSKRVGTRT